MRRPLCIVCLLFCLLWGVIGARLVTVPVPYPEGEQVTLQGRIYDDEVTDAGTRLYLTDVSKITQKQPFTDDSSEQIQTFLNTDIKVYFGEAPIYRVGETICVSGEVMYFKEDTNPGQFNQRKYQNIHGIGFALKKAQIISRSSKVRRMDDYLWRIRNRWAEVYKSRCEEQYGTMLSIFLGIKSDMETEIRELYQRAGIAHILAISGLHISFLGLLLYGGMRRIRIPDKMAFFITAAFLILYGRLTGMSASTQRAIIMLLVLLPAEFVGRTYDMLTAMSLSLFLVILKNPKLMGDSGFQLSFACVLAIGLGVPRFFEELLGDSLKRKRLTKKAGGFRRALCSSLGITLFTLPIVLNSYYSFSPYSIFLNLIVLPLMSAELFFGFVGGLLGMVLPFPANLLLRCAGWILSVYEWLCTVVERLPGSIWIVGKPALWQMVIYYIVLVTTVMAWQSHKRKQGTDYAKDSSAEKSGSRVRHKVCDEHGNDRQLIRYMAVIALSVALLSILVIPVRLKAVWKESVTLLDVGQGDCICLQIKGSVFFVDGGSTSEGEIAKYKIEPFLKSQGISTIDACFISHSDADHTNGIEEILERGQKSGIRCRSLVLTEYAKRHGEDYQRLLAAAEKASCPVVYMERGDCVERQTAAWRSRQKKQEEAFRLTCVAPVTGREYEDANDSSMALLMECGEFTMLFTGDMSQRVETEMLQQIQEKNLLGSKGVDVLKLSHHGSRSATSEQLLTVLSPQIAAVSAGRGNRYGHPHEEVISRLKEHQIPILRTDTGGAVTIQRRGGKWWEGACYAQ